MRIRLLVTVLIMGMGAFWLLNRNTKPEPQPSKEQMPQQVQLSDPTIGVPLYFGDLETIIQSDCSATFTTIRRMPIDAATPDDVLRLLLAGVTETEKENGLSDSFTNASGVLGEGVPPLLDFYKGIAIEDGMATVQFTDGGMRYLNSAACMQGTIKAPIEKTLLEFPFIDSVQYEVDGEVVTEWDA